MARHSKPGTSSLLKISVEIAPEAEDAVVELFSKVFGQPASVFWDLEQRRTVASVFIRALPRGHRAKIAAGLSLIRDSGLNVGPARIQVRRIRRENWAESWKRHFKPIEMGDRLVVLPSWSKRRPKQGQAKVVIDPGLSFGTGHHATTAFCLCQIAVLRDDRVPQSLLDIGCGSGILSIAAAKLGYSPVVAFDFDSDAVRIARENAKLNKVEINISRRDLVQIPAPSDRLFDVVCANLMYDLLIQERDRILNRLRSGGTLVLAGILKGQFPKVQRAYESVGLELLTGRTEREWRSGAFQLRP